MEDFATSMLDVLLVSRLRPRFPGSCIRTIVHPIFVSIEIECLMIDSHPLQSVLETGY